MRRLHILAVGSLGQPWLTKGCDYYTQRIAPYYKLQLTELSEHRLASSPSPAQIEQALQAEAEDFVAKTPKGAMTIALCLEGQSLSSCELAALLESAYTQSRLPTFMIGSSHGLAQTLKRQAHHRLSFSAMTFPHQLARLFLLEQVYRCGCITGGSKYHK